MHRYFARRPYNVFQELIKHYTEEGDIILDPFCGGGVTVVEGLRLRRRVIGVDINPLATYVTEMEIRPLDLSLFREAWHAIKSEVREIMDFLYSTECPECKVPTLFSPFDAEIQWCEWEGGEIRRIKYRCPFGHSGEKAPSQKDVEKVKEVEGEFDQYIREWDLWYPKQPIPPGDKTNSIIAKGYRFFYQLFTKRNLLALSILHKHIGLVKDRTLQDFLRFALSASLKWASKQSHLRGEIVEGWAMHAYWLYPRWLEINVWHTFEKRCQAIERGKAHARCVANYYHPAKSFSDFKHGATAMLLTQSADSLPLPDNSVDCIITDPPYGGNVNYGELSDYWLVWMEGIMDKTKEAVINKTQGKGLEDYEAILHSVFRECHRTLKPGRALITTFNSKDLDIIAAFLRAVVMAGFVLVPDGLIYQPPIRLYTTTVHAKDIGAFTGDFIFTFQRDGPESRGNRPVAPTPKLTQNEVDRLLDEFLEDSLTEVQARQRIYTALIPRLAQSIGLMGADLYPLVRSVERRIRNHKFPSLHFSKARSIAR
jgi:16S rRNA G966 N2-methylase RsmD